MTTKKKLISYNTIKNPLVAQFFDELDNTNLASHYVREAIEFYQQHKNNGTLDNARNTSESITSGTESVADGNTSSQ